MVVRGGLIVELPEVDILVTPPGLWTDVREDVVDSRRALSSREPDDRNRGRHHGRGRPRVRSDIDRALAVVGDHAVDSSNGVFSGRSCKNDGKRASLAIVVHEIEQLVLDDGPARSATKLLPLVLSLRWVLAVAQGSCLAERVEGIHCRVPQVVEEIAVNLV